MASFSTSCQCKYSIRRCRERSFINCQPIESFRNLLRVIKTAEKENIQIHRQQIQIEQEEASFDQSPKEILRIRVWFINKLRSYGNKSSVNFFFLKQLPSEVNMLFRLYFNLSTKQVQSSWGLKQLRNVSTGDMGEIWNTIYANLYLKCKRREWLK